MHCPKHSPKAPIPTAIRFTRHALCVQDELPTPAWTSQPQYRLDEPWFLYPGWRLRAWQLVDTPVAFKTRNIFGGDRILASLLAQEEPG